MKGWSGSGHEVARVDRTTTDYIAVTSSWESNIRPCISCCFPTVRYVLQAGHSLHRPSNTSSKAFNLLWQYLDTYMYMENVNLLINVRVEPLIVTPLVGLGQFEQVPEPTAHRVLWMRQQYMWERVASSTSLTPSEQGTTNTHQCGLIRPVHLGWWLQTNTNTHII